MFYLSVPRILLV